MEQRILPLRGHEAVDLQSRRSWLQAHYSAATRHRYETLEGKLLLLDTILKSRWIAASDTYSLQSLGIGFGDAVAQAMELKWALVEDDYGREPALVQEGTTVVVLPLTTLSKPVAAGEAVDVYLLFNAVCATIKRIQSGED